MQHPKSMTLADPSLHYLVKYLLQIFHAGEKNFENRLANIRTKCLKSDNI